MFFILLQDSRRKFATISVFSYKCQEAFGNSSLFFIKLSNILILLSHRSTTNCREVKQLFMLIFRFILKKSPFQTYDRLHQAIFLRTIRLLTQINFHIMNIKSTRILQSVNCNGVYIASLVVIYCGNLRGLRNASSI